MLNDNIANKFKMSPDPHLIGWNSTMSIQDILNRLELAYEHPTSHELLQNDALFRSPFRNTNAPKHLFWRIKQCQEIQVIADNLYTLMQLMTTTVQLLMSSGIFPAGEFEDWEAMPNKMYGSLKVFFHGAYARRFIAIQMFTTGQHGYVANPNNNMFQVFEDGASVTDDNTSVATITNQNRCQRNYRQHSGQHLRCLFGPGQSISVSPGLRCGGHCNQPAFHQSNGNVVAHAELVAARPCPTYPCCKSGGV
jgi:hypothetical protein